MQKIQSVNRGATSIGETRDCTVRALSNAGSMPYDQAHALLKKHGRKDRRGAFFSTMLKAYNEADFVLDSVHGTTGSARSAARIAMRQAQEGISLAKLLPKLAFGEYIVNTTGHAVAVVNGKIIDTFDNPAGKRVIAVFKKIEKFAE